jgi:apolipoprotein D and lipocalin family protein
MKAIPRLAVATLLILTGCAGIPSGVRAVEDLDVRRYMGTWYEIARLDHRFERGLSNVSATYTLRDDGGVDVHNRGYDAERGIWKEVQGRAYPVKGANAGRFKVTFFWPFYGGYNVIALDREAYSYATVCGPSRSYLWILARETKLPQRVLESLVDETRELGFPVDRLIYVRHGDPGAGSPGE